ncbi:MAG: aminoacyl-tRNA hydrolase [Xanthomonadales bacterium]|jgi:PTH1 family peptidyl-tRNA hydrolase|nr:aminoacyl-tRNA hydrolase [Xanthomonadales bacterium]MDH4001706.1 aminoacyl-tRNA hydrolase [Xanthomonadales bacterium]
MPYLIVGLGNPGPKYTETRHNAGFWFLDQLARTEGVQFKEQSRLRAETGRLRMNGHDCILAKPTTFMNHSGQAVRAVMDYYQVTASDLLVAYDELDLPPGIARLKQGGGHGGHNGMRDIFRHTVDHEFLRLRIGIGHPGSKDAVTAYVLGRATAAQEKLIIEAISDAVRELPRVLAGDVAGAMKELHTVRDDGL